VEQPIRTLLVGETLPSLAGAISQRTAALGLTLRLREVADASPRTWEADGPVEGMVVVEARNLGGDASSRVREILSLHPRVMVILIASLAVPAEQLKEAALSPSCVILHRLDAEEIALALLAATGKMTLRESEAACRERVRALEQKADILFQNSPNAMFVLDARTGRIRAFNQKAFESFGYTRNELTNMMFRFLFPESASQSSDALLKKLSVRHGDFEEQEFRRADGRIQVYDLSARFVTWEGQVAIIAELRETAGRIETRRERDLYRRVFDECTEAVAILDAKGTFLFVNPAFVTMTGHAREQIIGRTPLILNSGEVPQKLVDEIRTVVMGGQVWKGSLDGNRQGNEPVHLDVVIAPVRERLGTISCFVVVASDKTEEANLRRSLTQSQRMEAIGHLAGGIAHDFNNILTVIQSAGSFLSEGLDRNHPLQEEVREILASSNRAGELTKQLLSYSRRRGSEKELTDLNDVVSPLLRMLRRIIGDNIELNVDCRDGRLPVHLDATQVQQILFNLVSNARDAMPDGGLLSVSTWEESLSPEVARVLDMPVGRYALLEVADTGTGMTEDVLSRIFDPYFTTKEEGKGTGIGLATVNAIVRQAGGSVFAESTPGKGSKLTVRLPLQRLPSHKAAAPSAGTSPQTTGVILLAEDEPAVRRLATRVLRQRGYEVVEASDGLEAMDQAREMGGAFDMLVTDVTMPRMSGIRLAESLRAEKPELPVLFICGFSEDETIRKGLTQGHLGYLQKPFTPADLAERVGLLLAEARAHTAS
jgi:two-component system cell cycle sensor histidine kinase/response regulator CckA